ncbi:MAG TPA: hypothetical protein VK983_01205 [Candidatus Limnocylindrales bacterium]|nr:hypothetical protein [Candidatus Limnocylindrales bacterium]
MTFKRKVRRAGYLLAAIAFTLGIVSAVKPQPVEAYGLLASRSIRLSSSANGATNTAYAVGFNTVTDGQTVGSVVIKYCGNSPIIGETCTAPTGFNTNFSTLTLNSLTGNITGLTINTLSSTSNMLLLTRTAGAVANGPVSFVLGNGTTNGITNPTNSNTTFYARILVFPSSSPDLTQSGENTATDAGGTAMSTANVLNVTAKVQETLIFCVYTALNCAGGGSAVNLGDANGVLSDTTTTYTSTANFDLASNALGGVAVKLKGDTLTSGAFTISPHGAVCTADSTATSVEQFGLRVSAVGAGQTAASPLLYGCLTGNHTFDVANTNTTYGQDIVTTPGATDRSSSTIELAAKAAGTTEAGIYTTTLQLIATATY